MFVCGFVGGRGWRTPEFGTYSCPARARSYSPSPPSPASSCLQALRASIAAGEDPRATRRSTLLELEAAIVHSTSLANDFKLEDNDLELAIKVRHA